MLAKAFLLLGLAGAAAFDLTMSDEYTFSDYIRDFDKKYATMDEVVQRRAIFEARLYDVKHHNTFKASAYRKGVNRFTDRTDEELKAMLGYKPSENHFSRERNFESVQELTDLPESVNWVEKGAVTWPKNQGQCGSCWAFSGTAAIESAVYLATGKLLNISEQAFVSCMSNPAHCGGRGGCDGATQDLLFKYAKEKGVVLADDYEYVSGDGSNPMCTLRNKPKVGGIRGYVNIKDNDMQAHLEAVATAPVAVSVDATTWHAYHSGVLPFEECGATLNHAVLLVGYGKEEGTGEDYWLIRNSWGADWGVEGNIKISRSNKCAIDENPADGVACATGPSNITVCGTCGVLFASSRPIGAYLN